MPAKPITLGPLNFSRRGDAVAYLKEMLRRYDVGDKVSDEDAVILRAALENHPRSDAKIAGGVTYFSVRSADYGTKCFWVNRPDGSTEKFSITASIHSPK
ncbi:DCL family protein [Pseudoduganella sp. SL102]|uniref:DCL family protein n=1 Tax=Pseudoduganella sp. SL102 TaxID=2995154 RepID=UPI00248AC691|nr:DCL family protein [Pseudoduganella sp. SL102]WBS02028.1 DCL family protein [Pseudoduganella sp. SL102]